MKYSSQNMAPLRRSPTFPTSPIVPTSHCSLSELFDWIHCESPAISCPYLVLPYLPYRLWSAKSPCREMISPENCRHAKLRFATINSVLSKHFREPSDEILLSDTLDGLANTALCNKHVESTDEARDQWYMELNDGKILSKMEATYGNFSDGNLSDKEERSGEVNVSERIPVPDIQSSSYKWVLCTPDIHDSKVAENVTRLLESKLEGLNSQCGWIYIFSTDADGMFKIGFSSRPPSLHRFAAHMTCYKQFIEVMTVLIPYARLLEQLVLTELAGRHCRLAEKCVCGKLHKGWLMIDQETLLQTVKKWVEFIECFPYSAQGILKEGLVLPSPALNSQDSNYKDLTPQKSSPEV